MPQLQSRRHCKFCERKTLHERPSFSSTLGCLFSVFTLGLFIPVWLLIGVWEAMAYKWRCQSCGGGRRL